MQNGIEAFLPWTRQAKLGQQRRGANMSGSLQLIADRQALGDLVNAYARAADQRDKELMRSLFSDHALVEVPGHCCDSIDDFILALDGLNRFTATLHCVHNHVPIVTGDQAEAESYCVATHLYNRDTGSWKMEWGIRYIDRYKRCHDGWKISYRRLILVWQQHSPLGSGP
jgi:hypothetical protein